MTAISKLHVRSNTPLPAPEALAREIPAPAGNLECVRSARENIAAILHGHDDRLLLSAGPCSIHDVDAGLEYASRLLVMRVYFEKPRTSTGGKGLIMDPSLDGTHNIPAGLRQARWFLREVISPGVPTATEMLDPMTPQSIADLAC